MCLTSSAVLSHQVRHLNFFSPWKVSFYRATFRQQPNWRLTTGCDCLTVWRNFLLSFISRGKWINVNQNNFLSAFGKNSTPSKSGSRWVVGCLGQRPRTFKLVLTLALAAVAGLVLELSVFGVSFMLKGWVKLKNKFRNIDFSFFVKMTSK